MLSAAGVPTLRISPRRDKAQPDLTRFQPNQRTA
jgi:hypothetical protein